MKRTSGIDDFEMSKIRRDNWRDQPRDPKGTSTGGQWTRGGGVVEAKYKKNKNANHAPGRSGDIVKNNQFTPEEGGYLYHGTTTPNGAEYLTADSDGVLYMTNDFKEAQGYAEGVSLSKNYGGTPRVVAISTTSDGKMADVQLEIDQAVEDGGNFTDIFSKYRNLGFDYVFYKHPGIYSEEQDVIVILNPSATLGPIQRMFTWNV